MIDSNIIRPYLTSAVDFDETEKLKRHLMNLKQTRNPFYLDFNDFNRILEWKLRQQYGRLKKYKEQNTEEIIEKITSLALSILHEDKNYEIELRFKLLTALKGVGNSIASAILALCFPEQYTVIDFRGWRQVFDVKKRKDFTINDYKLYLGKIRILASELGRFPQEVDLAIWEYDRRNSKR